MRSHRALPAWVAAAASVALLGASQPTEQDSDVGTDFVNDVLPVLTRAGCNTGECHGAALGQGRFALSLHGYDPEADWDAITRELRGRRIDRVHPADSLILRKPSRRTDHEGGRPLPTYSEGYGLLEAWIEAGAPFRTEVRELERVELDLRAGDDAEALRVTAHYTDGSSRDVTRLAVFSSNDASVAAVDEHGAITRHRPGATSIVVRYGDQLAVHGVAIPFGEVCVDLPAKSFVDEHVAAHFERMGLELPADAADHVFLRRAFLDLTGRLPAPDDVRRFLTDPDRDALVEHLLDRPEFVEHWAYRLAELFPPRADLVPWLRERLAADESWAEIARAVLLSEGTHPGIALYDSNDPKLIGETAFQSLLGARIHCAQCHNHPFLSFTQRDYFGAAAFFARTRLEDGAVKLVERGDVRWRDTQEVVPPTLPGGETPAADDAADRRRPLADWFVSRPEFARMLANRVWAVLMGEGLVEPVDDMRPSNPAWSEPLLDALAADVVAHDMSLRHLVRTIATSASYGRLKAPHRMPAEVLVDAIADVTGVADRERAVVSPTQPSATLDVSGRREDFEGSLAQSLHLIGSDAMHEKLEQMEELDVETLFLRAYSRPPTDLERRLEPQGRIAFEDLVWAVLNSEEFLYVR